MEGNVLPKAWESLIKTADFLPVIIKSIERVHDETWSMDLSRHDFFEMVYMKKGSAIFEISGEAVPFEPNDIIIIKPGRAHRFFVKNRNVCDFIVLSFRFENYLNEGVAVAEISIEDFLNFVKGGEFGNYIKLKVSRTSDIITLLNRIIKERSGLYIDSEFLNHLLVMELFVLLSRALKMEWEDSIKGKKTKIRELVALSINYIEENYLYEISPGDVAKYVFLSHSYFTRIFKDETGISPMEYIQNTRVQKAKELLTDTCDNMGDVAALSGFSSQQRFNDVFKKHTEMTPLQYRKSQKT